MIKVNVANYMISDLSKRFPFQSENIVDDEIIDVLIDRWSNKKYVVPNSSERFYHNPPQNHPYLM